MNYINQTVKQGVPQGSVLGPTFYIVYANDLTQNMKECKIVQYADDTVLYTSNPLVSTSVEKMQNDINALTTWCSNNGILAYTDKTKLMMFGSKRAVDRLPNVRVTLDGVPLHMVTSYKYLGITLDNQLKLNKHVQKTVAIASNKLTQFRRMRGFLNEKVSLLVYKNTLLPILEYGDILHTGISVENKRRLHTLQNKGLRCALRRGIDTSTDALHCEAKLLTLEYRRQNHLLNFMFDHSQDLNNLKSGGSLGVMTRSSRKKLMKIKRPKTEKFKKSLAYHGPKRWNELSEDFHNILDKPSFKSRARSLVEGKAVREGLIEINCI